MTGSYQDADSYREMVKWMSDVEEALAIYTQC